MKYVLLEPEEIIDSPQFKFTTTFLKSTGRTQVGWHYSVDLAWIYSQAQNWPANYRILDAGGGFGPTQFLLAELGFNVTNIDLFLDYSTLRFQERYKMEFRTSENYQKTNYVTHLASTKNNQSLLKKLKGTLGSSRLYQYISSIKYRQIHEKWRKDNQVNNNVGQLKWTKANLYNIPEIGTNSFDAVVSLSALEHIPIDQLPQVWTQISRICKPDAKMAITTSATEQKNTWFHEPSKGYCYSEQDLKTLFKAFPEATSQSANDIIEKYRSCKHLKNNIAEFYSKSGDNGMPWGEWNPRYIPVGLFR